MVALLKNLRMCDRFIKIDLKPHGSHKVFESHCVQFPRDNSEFILDTTFIYIMILGLYIFCLILLSGIALEGWETCEAIWPMGETVLEEVEVGRDQGAVTTVLNHGTSVCRSPG